MGITKTVLRAAAPPPKIEGFTSFLFIGPHPDDIEIGAGATAARLAAMGKKITFLILTDGRYGDGYSGGLKGDDLAELRKQESIRSAERLGVTDVRFLDLSDGGFYPYEEMVRGIAKTVGECGAELIFAPDPFTGRELHVDHLNAGKAASHIAYMAPYGGIMERYGAGSADVKAIAYYMTARANRFVKIPKEMFELQKEAIFSCHKSQFPEGSSEAKQFALYMKLRSADFGLRRLCSHAEGFCVLGRIHMHCVPEVL